MTEKTIDEVLAYEECGRALREYLTEKHRATFGDGISNNPKVLEALLSEFKTEIIDLVKEITK